MVIFLFVIFNSSYTTFFSVHLVNQCICLRCFRFSLSTSVNKHISGTGAFHLSVRSSVSLRPTCIDACQTLINARFNERRTDANRGDILSSHDKNQIHVHNHARVHTMSYVSVIIEPFWSFCVINMPKRLFFFLITGSEHDETISAGV